MIWKRRTPRSLKQPASGGRPRHPSSETRPRRAYADWADERLLSSQVALSRRSGETAQPAPRRDRRALLLWAGLTLLGGAAALIAAHANGPRLRTLADETLALHLISVEGAGRISSNEIADATGLVYGMSLLAVDSRAAEARLLAHPWVSGARVIRLPPGRVLVSVSLRTPVAFTQPGEDAQPRLVDESGLAFAPASSEDVAALPRIVTAVVATPEGGAGPLAEGAQAARALERADLGVPGEIHLGAPGDPDGVWLRVPRVPGRIVLGAGDFDAKLAQLRTLLAAGLPVSEAAATIDLRFAGRAVLRSSPPPVGAAGSAAAPGGAPPPRDRAG